MCNDEPWRLLSYDRFSSSINCPDESVPKIYTPIDHDAASSSSKGRGTTDTTDFLPDSFILGNKVMHTTKKHYRYVHRRQYHHSTLR